MALFTKRSVAAGTLPPVAQPQTVIQQPQHWGRIVVAVFACLVTGVVLGWWAICFLAEQAGSEQPGRDVAQFIIWLVCGGGGLYGASVAGGRVYANYQEQKRKTLAMIHQHQERMAHTKLLAARNNATGGREIEANYNMVLLAKAVLIKAYEYHDQHGNYGRKAKPWKRDNAAEVAIENKIKIIRVQVAGLESFLVSHKMLRGDELDRDMFPEYEDACHELDELYSPPLIVNGGHASLPYQEVTSIIEN